MTKIHLQNKLKLKVQTEGNEIVWVDDLWIDRPDIAKQLQFERMFSRCKLFDRQVPLYQKQKPLTEEEIRLLVGGDDEAQEWNRKVVKAIERAHGIGVEDEPDQRST